MKNNRGKNIKNLKSKLAIFLVILLVLNIVPLPENVGNGITSFVIEGLSDLQKAVGNRVNNAFAADDRDYLLKEGDFQVNLAEGGSKEPYTLVQDSATLVLRSVLKNPPNTSQAVSGAKIKLNDTTENVVKAEVISAGNGDSTGIKFTKKGAGSKQISGSVEIGSTNYNFSFFVKVDLEIDKTNTTTDPKEPQYKQIFATDKGPNTLVMPVVNGKYQIKLKGYKESTPDGYLKYSGSVLNWSTSVNGKNNDDSVLEVEQSNGVITAVGAGVAEVSVAAGEDPTGKVKPTSTMVVVPLKMSTENVVGGNYRDFNENVTGREITLDGGKKTIFTNMLDPNDIEWEVKKDGKVVKNILSFNNTRVKTTDSASSLQIEGKRAGTYDVTASLKKVKGDYKDIRHIRLTFKVTVPLTAANATVYMNVGDTYNIYNNSNIGNIKDFTFTADSSGTVKVDGATSIITALKTGTGTVTVSDGTTSFVITVGVIDNIALSASNLTIPVGGTVDLNAVATDVSTSDSWNWFSDNESIAKVTGNGVNAVVKGIAAGETTVTVEHTVGGITKRVSCKITVTAAVTKITLTPAETIIEVNKVASIKAELTPKTSSGTYLYWRSSNPEIVQVDDENNHTAVASVTGKAPGTAIIMALNKENVVLGSAKVIVNTPVTGIILSQSVVEKPLSDKTFQLTATVTPKEATSAKLNWKSTNEKVAQVDANGLVTFKSAGHASIIASSDINPQITATCDLTIIKTVDSIKLDKTEITLAVGETYKLGATISPSDASNQNLNYKSLDPKVADISKTGLITGKQAGTAYITVSTPDGKVTANCTVKVTQKATGMKLSAASLILDVGESYTLEVTFNPKNTTETKVLWSVSDKSVAKVDAKGKVTAIAAGETLITAKSSNGLTAVCKVKVNQPVGNIELNYTEYSLAVDDELELEVTFDNDDVTNKKVKWKSSQSSIASVDKNGVVKGKKGGVAIITVTADENGMQASCVVTVEEPISEIKLNKTAYNLGYHKSFLLKAKLKTNSATNKVLKWSSSKNSIVSVNKSGQIYGKKPGYATIKVKATDGSGAEATARIRVVREAGSISANPSFLAMVVGRRKTIKVKINPKNATYKTAKFISDNTDVAMVDSKGRVTALAAGKAKITVAAKDNSGKKQAVVVQVREYIPATGLTLSNTTLTMGIGDKQSTIYSIVPSDTDDRVKWSTNNKAVAKVNKKGLITAVGSGNATITASTTSGKTAQIAVTVVGLNFYSLDLEQYDTYTLSVLGDVKNIAWDSENPEIATVVNGLVTAKKPGSTTILARVNGAVLRCRVKVKNIH